MKSGDHNGMIEINKGGRVPLMWPAALCSCPAALSCGWVELLKNLPTLKKKKYMLKVFSNVMVGYFCVQSLPEWA